MNIVVIGAGEVGYTVAKNLSQDGHAVILIEQDPDRATKAENELDVMVVRGNGARPNVLEKAGITEGTQTELLIACSSRDEVNMLACWIARKRGVKRVISRAVGMEFTDSDTWSRDLGIDMLVSPERSVAREIAGILETKTALLSSEIDDKAGFYAFKVEEGSAICGLDLMQLRQKMPNLITIVVYIKRGEGGFIPKASDVIEAGDICYSFDYISQINDIAATYQADKRKRMRRVLIVGAGKIGFQTAQHILSRKKNVDVRLIEIDKAKCDKVAQDLIDENGMVLWGDGADEEMLVQEGVPMCDGFVAATEDDEKNIVLASFAKTLGAGKSIAIVRRRAYSKLASVLPIDALVNRNETLSSAIISAVRNPGNASTLMVFDSLGAETMQVTIPEGSPAVGVQLKDLPLPEGAVVGLVRRHGTHRDILIPTGSFHFIPQDKAIIFSSQDAVDKVLEVLGAASA